MAGTHHASFPEKERRKKGKKKRKEATGLLAHMPAG